MSIWKEKNFFWAITQPPILKINLSQLVKKMSLNAFSASVDRDQLLCTPAFCSGPTLFVKMMFNDCNN